LVINICTICEGVEEEVEEVYVAGLLSVGGMIFEGAVDGEGDVVVLTDRGAEVVEEEDVRHAGVGARIDGDCAALQRGEQLDF
jgi:hypothetical protein